jgi:hypothetical protein
VNRPTLRAIGWIVRSICSASSRVGARISAFGLRPNSRRLPAWLRRILDQRRAERDRLARAGAAAGEHVLALEDRAIVAAWIGNGAAAPRSASARTMLSPRPRLTERHIGDLFGLDGLACSFSCTVSACSS